MSKTDFGQKRNKKIRWQLQGKEILYTYPT